MELPHRVALLLFEKYNEDFLDSIEDAYEVRVASMDEDAQKMFIKSSDRLHCVPAGEMELAFYLFCCRADLEHTQFDLLVTCSSSTCALSFRCFQCFVFFR